MHNTCTADDRRRCWGASNDGCHFSSILIQVSDSCLFHTNGQICHNNNYCQLMHHTPWIDSQMKTRG